MVIKEIMRTEVDLIAQSLGLIDVADLILKVSLLTSFYSLS